MKNLKYLLIALSVTLILIGGAFAAWTDTLTIDGTVETGEVDIEYFVRNFTASDHSDASYELSDCKKFITVTVNNAYPGFSFALDYGVINKGNIPVKLAEFTSGGMPEIGSVSHISPSGAAVIGPEAVHNLRFTWRFSKFEDVPQDYELLVFTITHDWEQWNTVN